MARLSTPLCDALDLEYPIVQAPIGSLATPELAAAVSNAGGLGTLAVTWLDPGGTRRAIRRTRELTDRPFAVNLVLDDATTIHPTDEHLAACLEAGVPVVSFSFGDPAPHLPACRDAGVPVVATVGSAEMAENVVEAGVDAVCAQGWEAGGHLQSDVATMALVPRVADAVPETPVIAAGGVGDGRGIAAAIALGADGAWLGTRFVASEEARTHEAYADAVASARETDTVRSQLFDGGWPGRDHRVLATETVERWDAAGRPPPGERPGEGETVAELPGWGDVERYDDVPPTEGTSGDPESMALYAGQSVGLADAIHPAGDVVADLVEETRDAASRLGDAVRER